MTGPRHTLPQASDKGPRTRAPSSASALQMPNSAVQTPKVTVNLPPPLTHDVTYRQYTEWKQRWNDYAVMVDLDNVPRPKQLIELRAYLSVEMRRMLEHDLGIPPDSTMLLDDVLAHIETYIKVSGKDKREHRERLRAVLKKLEEHNIRVNRSKCIIEVDSVEYLSFVINSKGIHKTKEKINAVISTKVPEKVKELH
ncbi:uncharacterized protein [Palaemon carinicauda]|uniref:uncharacterized protein n=1 Tax=Palaemon carinicauda TaxID=392227 RepID=UPI0035B60053